MTNMLCRHLILILKGIKATFGKKNLIQKIQLKFITTFLHEMFITTFHRDTEQKSDIIAEVRHTKNEQIVISPIGNCKIKTLKSVQKI